MDRLKRGDKIYLDLENKKESSINQFLDCRDGVIEVYEYNDCSGYGSKTRLFLCQNTKHEVIAIVRQSYSSMSKEWTEEEMFFDTDSFVFMKALINNKSDEFGAKFSVVRDYSID